MAETHASWQHALRALGGGDLDHEGLVDEFRSCRQMDGAALLGPNFLANQIANRVSVAHSARESAVFGKERRSSGGCLRIAFSEVVSSGSFRGRKRGSHVRANGICGEHRVDLP